jgi:hypothetical protein
VAQNQAEPVKTAENTPNWRSPVAVQVPSLACAPIRSNLEENWFVLAYSRHP